MVYRISEISREVLSGFTYALVDFWRSQADFAAQQRPYLTNDFIMQFTVPDNARRDMDENIRNYWRSAMAFGWTGDHTADRTKPFKRKGITVVQRATPALVRDMTDNGIIERQDIKDEVGRVR